MTTGRIDTLRSAIARGLVVAGVLLGVTIMLKRLSPEHVSPDVARRALGVLLGAVVVLYANAVPKALSPLMSMRWDPAAEQAARRLTGWSLVLGGAAYAVTWLVAPLAYANVISGSLLATALLVVVVRLARGTTNRAPGEAAS